LLQGERAARCRPNDVSTNDVSTNDVSTNEVRTNDVSTNEVRTNELRSTFGSTKSVSSRSWRLTYRTVTARCASVLKATVMCGVLAIAAVVPLSESVTAQPPVVEAPPSEVEYTPPVAAPIIDPFRPPETFAGAGNRGLEYGVTAGTPIMAAADGTVVFSGQVGGRQFITIAHADGVETTYSFLSERRVIVGDRVVRGQVIALSGATFHFGAKVGDGYLDPETLFAASRADATAVLGTEPIAAGRAILVAT